jgi:hypothetical protein
MGNPWTKKNPFMSMWLSSANSIIGSARGKATAEIKRQATSAQADATRQIFDLWSGKPAARRPGKNAVDKFTRPVPTWTWWYANRSG